MYDGRNAFDDSQMQALGDYVESALMLRFNRPLKPKKMDDVEEIKDAEA